MARGATEKSTTTLERSVRLKYPVSASKESEYPVDTSDQGQGTRRETRSLKTLPGRDTVTNVG